MTSFRQRGLVTARRRYSPIDKYGVAVHVRVCVGLVGRAITVRSAYKGMHQGGNKSGARRESICFHLHGRIARMGDVDEREREQPDKQPTTRTAKDEGREWKGPTADGERFRAGGIAKSRELFMEWLLKSYRRQPPHSRKTRTRYPRLTRPRERENNRPEIWSALVIFLGRNNTGRSMSGLKDFAGCPMSSFPSRTGTRLCLVRRTRIFARCTWTHGPRGFI